MRSFLTVVLVLALISLVLPRALPAEEPSVVLEDGDGNKLFEQDPQFPECLGPEDPFCPLEPGSSGTEGGGSGGTCDLCERVPDPAFYSGGVYRCVPVVNETDTGRTECTDGGEMTRCAMGGAFCQKITVTG